MAADRYRIVRKLGRGGMAEVFEAVAAGEGGFQRRVAIKRVHDDALQRAGAIDMFLDEARVASRLHHANIVSIFDFGVADGAPFQVLEFVDGLDLVELLERCEEDGREIPEEIALAICIEVANGLAYAHSASGPDGTALGIVHRDVSPANVLVSWQGDVKLSDFGIALATERTHVTQDGTTKGTLLFMAPEQMVRGEVDARSDVFALACVLHTLVTGESPLEGQDAMAQLLAGNELALTGPLSADLAEIIRRGLQPSKSRRYPSAGAMAEAMGAALVPRLSRDPKGMLREWLAELRPRAQRPAPAAAALFQLTMVGEAEGRRTFDTTEPSREIQTPASRRAVAVLSALLTAGGIAAGALIWMSTGSGHNAATRARAVAEDNSVQLVASEVQILPPPSDASPLDAQSPPIDAQPTVGRTRDPAPRVRPSKKRGVVAIGGKGAHRAEILVDGRSRGYAPRALTLPVGNHRIELVAPGGKVHKKSIVLKGSHTETRPLRWTVR